MKIYIVKRSSQMLMENSRNLKILIDIVPFHWQEKQSITYRNAVAIYIPVPASEFVVMQSYENSRNRILNRFMQMLYLKISFRVKFVSSV